MSGYDKPGIVSDLAAGNTVDSESLNRIASKQPTHTYRSRLNYEDVEKQDALEDADEGSPTSDSYSSIDSNESIRALGETNTLTPTATSDKIILSFANDDPENPYAWSGRKKMFTILVSILCVMNSTVASGLASNSASFFGTEFGVRSNYLLILPTSLFLLGYVIGPIFWGPMSEQYGRKHIMICAFAFFSAFMLGCALAPNLAALSIFRFLSGVGAACPIVVVGGTCADIYKNPEARGRAMAVFMATTFGPCAGPVISGYLSPLPHWGWRWSFWVGLVFAGIAFVPLLLVEETYAPILLLRKAKEMRKQSGNEQIRAPIELEPKVNLRHLVSIVLTRPLRMFVFEAIVLFSCLYLSFAYGIFYMFFQAFPIIYIDTYGFSLGQEGLTFLAIGIGACFAIIFYLGWDWYTARARARKEKWIEQEEMRRLPLACLAGPFFIASCFWLGWSARPDVHWIVPVLSGIGYGIGYLLCFMALLNYLVDAYKIFAASAMAAASMCRSLFGAVLPFGARPMYEHLGVPWACSLLGFLSVGLAIIPFVFIWKGEAIRARSQFCRYLLQKELEEEEKRQKREARDARRRDRETGRAGSSAVLGSPDKDEKESV